MLGYVDEVVVDTIKWLLILLNYVIPNSSHKYVGVCFTDVVYNDDVV